MIYALDEENNFYRAQLWAFVKFFSVSKILYFFSSLSQVDRMYQFNRKYAAESPVLGRSRFLYTDFFDKSLVCFIIVSTPYTRW